MMIAMKESISSEVTDEINFDEHSKKHDIKLPPEFKYKFYREFNLNNPDFQDLKNYYNFLNNQNKSTTLINITKIVSSSPFRGMVNEEGSWLDATSFT